MKKDKSTYTPARKKAIYEHNKKIERIYLTVPAGRKSEIESQASACGLSLNAYICRCIDNEMNGNH